MRGDTPRETGANVLFVPPLLQLYYSQRFSINPSDTPFRLVGNVKWPNGVLPVILIVFFAVVRDELGTCIPFANERMGRPLSLPVRVGLFAVS
jgi:hypothetical protein